MYLAIVDSGVVASTNSIFGAAPVTPPSPKKTVRTPSDATASDLYGADPNRDWSAAASSGLAMAMRPDRTLRVAAHFEDSDDARENLRPRAELAVGDAVELRPMMNLALSYDHRIVDGREAVTFLVRVKECIEDPERILLDI